MASESPHQKWLLSIISIVAAIGGLLFGYDTGVISGAILYIKQEFPTTTGQEELIIGIVSLGAIFGSLLGGFLSDCFGRKKIVLFSQYFIYCQCSGSLTCKFYSRVDYLALYRWPSHWCFICNSPSLHC